MHVEFDSALGDGWHPVGNATLGPDGTVVVTDAPGETQLSEALLGPRPARMSDDGGKTFLTPADGERYLRALTGTYRGQVLRAVLIP